MSDVQIITIDSSERQFLFDVANKLEGQASVANLPESYANGGASYAKLGRRFGVSATTVGCIIRRRSWSHYHPTTIAGAA